MKIKPQVLAQLAQLEQNLGYQFQDRHKLILALTHRSFAAANNERLEFLGDALLNAMIAETLYQQFPSANEGELTRMRAHLIKRDTLAKLGKKLAVSSFLFLGGGELKSGGRNRESAIADSMEAIIAAIYLDADLATCKKSVLEWYQPLLGNIHDITYTNKDHKTQLQEYLQAKHLALPTYELVVTEGPAHAKIFSVTCKIDGYPTITYGRASNLRIAEQQAAQAALKLLTASTHKAKK